VSASRPTLRQLEYVAAVAEYGSFSRAAAAMYVSQPGLSAQIAELERRLGAALFERGRSECTLTVTGAALLGRVRSILLDVDDLVREAGAHRDSVVGVIRIGAIPTIAPYLLPTLSQTLRRLWPDVELVLVELRSAELVAAIRAGEVDLGLLARPVDTGPLHVADLAFEPFVLAAAEGHPILDQKTVAPEHLRSLEVMVLEDGHCLRYQVLDVCDLANATNRRSAVRTSLPVLTQMVASSDAVTLLPLTSVEVEARPGTGISTVPLTDPDLGRTLSIAWRQRDPRSEHFESMIVDLTGTVTERIRTSMNSLLR